MVSDDLAPGLRTLALRYEFISELGRGGMATVYLARERDSGRLVAVKAVDGRHAQDREALARFAREARTVAALDHPNIVRTFAVEQTGDEAVAIVMQHVPGGTLREALLREGPFDFERAERVLAEVAEALRYAHARGLVHRDVKPENVFLEQGSGRALLSDFGIARAIEEENRLTLTGTSIGTPTYMSPEQIDGRTLDGRSDIYSLGLVGWEMLAGARPWEGESLYRVIYKQKHEELPRLTALRPGIPEHLLFAIEGALHKDRDTRWADVDEFLTELAERPVATPAAGREDGVAAAAVPASGAADDGEVALERPAAESEALLTPSGAGDAVVASPRHPDRLTMPGAGRARALSRLAVPLALAVLAAIAVGGARRAHRRSVAAATESVTRDSVTRSASAGELEPLPPVAPPPDSSLLVATTSSRVATAPVTAAPPRPRPARGARNPSSPSSTSRVARTHADSLALCRSPASRDQRACLAASIEDNDRGLNNVYRTLIGEMRKQARVAVGAADPRSVTRLREQQRAWLDDRDAECRRRGGGREGPLWAPSRARCLGELSTRRAAVLAKRLTDLRAPP